MRNYLEINSPKKVYLDLIPTRIPSQQGQKKSLDKNIGCLSDQQTLLYANHERSMLIIFQGMDTAGKDGAIKHVMSGVNPQGCSVVSFKTPTTKELEHDFLWRANLVLPERGMIGIFNRSYYEEALITRVHPELLKAEKLPSGKQHDSVFWKFRYHDIVHYEKYLHRQGYEIIKIFIHISKKEQKKRLSSRFNDPKKVWKIAESDVRERAFWKEYQVAYQECLEQTSSKSGPWYIVPGDDKESARLCISQILAERFKSLKLKYPKLTSHEEKKLKKLKAVLNQD
jgi:PPK2 family polyphosphate:nucleotide phosphotransferase